MEFKDLHRDVIGRGLCTGCGSCVGICPTKVMDMVYIDHEPEPVLSGNCNGCSLCYEMCPGKDIPFPAMEKLVYGREKEPDNEPLGIYRACVAGYATDDEIRSRGTSGGIASALLIYALEQGLIDQALVGEWDADVPWHTRPLAASSREDVLRAAKTKSQVVFTNALIGEALQKGGKVATVGVGCHIEAVRKLQVKYPSHRLSKSVAFTLGLFCYSNYYTFATELIILERTGIKSLDEVARVEYRVGKPHGNLRVTGKDGQVYLVQGTEAHMLFRAFSRNRCDMCLDWCNELSDIALGDYWGDRVDGKDMKPGWSTIIVRTETGERLLKDAEAKGYIATFPTEASHLLLTGGFYKKKHTNVYNIMKRRRYSYPVPDFGRPLSIEPLKREVSFDFHKAPHLKWRAELEHST